jgi:hypothetical protein
MSKSQQEEHIRERVEQLFAFPLIEDPKLLKLGRIGTPIRLFTPLGDMHSWFVPVLIVERLVGFFQLDSVGEFMRFSSFNTSPGVFDTCPSADNWLNRNRIIMTAKSMAHDNEILDKPFLSYDGSPERIAWIVKARSSAGECRNLMVTGDVVYVGREQAGLEY